MQTKPMNRNRVIVTFDYWDDETFRIVREWVFINERECTLRDDYPSFWVTIDTGDRTRNLRLMQELADYVRG